MREEWLKNNAVKTNFKDLRMKKDMCRKNLKDKIMRMKKDDVARKRREELLTKKDVD